MIGAIGIRQTDLLAFTPFDVGLSVATIDSTYNYVSSMELFSPDGVPLGTTNLTVPAPANGGSDTDTLNAGAGAGFTVNATGNKSAGTALTPTTVDFLHNSVIVHTDNIAFGDPVAGAYTFTGVAPGDLLEVVITEI
jgi:hypothetical protein